MKSMLLAAFVATSIIPEKGELHHSESVTICDPMVTEAVLDSFEESGFAPMIGVLQMFASLGMCHTYEGHFILFPDGDSRSHGATVVTSNRVILEDGIEKVVFRKQQAF